MVKRKTPIRHTVKRHKHMGKWVEPFERGKGVSRTRVGKVVRSKFIDPEDRRRNLQERMRVLEERYPHLKRDKFSWNITALEEIRKEIMETTPYSRAKKGITMGWDTLERIYDADFGWPYGPSGDELVMWHRDYQRHYPGLMFGLGITFLRLPGEE